MISRRRFPVFATIRTVILLLSLIAIQSGCTGNASTGARHAVVRSSGKLSIAWRIAGRDGATVGPTAYDQMHHVLYYVSSKEDEHFDTVSAVNVATGALLWQKALSIGPQSFPNPVSGLLVYKNLLVVEPSTFVMEDGGEASISILDTATGDTMRILGLGPSGIIAGISQGNLILSQEGWPPQPGGAPISPTLAAFSLSSGRERWHRAFRCGGSPVADEKVIAATCGKFITGMSPTDGSVIWHYRVGNSSALSYSLYLHDGIIEARGDTSVTFLDDNGRKIIAAPIGTNHGSQIPVYFGVSGSHLVFIGDDSGHLTVTNASVTTGRVVGRFVLPAGVYPAGRPAGDDYFPAGIDISGDAAYLSVALPTPFLGDAVLAVNTNDGSRVLRFEPMHLVGDLAQPDAPPVLPNTLTANVNGSTMLIGPSSPTADGLAAYHTLPPVNESPTRGPIAVQGTPGQWPRACSLLAPADKKILATNLGSRYRAVQALHPAGPGLPAASTCTYVSAAATTGNVTVSVVWNADSTAEAMEVLTANSGQFGGRALSGPWNLAYRIDNGSLITDGVAMTAGTLDIEVSDTFHGVSQPFAAKLVAWLQAKHR